MKPDFHWRGLLQLHFLEFPLKIPDYIIPACHYMGRAVIVLKTVLVNILQGCLRISCKKLGNRSLKGAAIHCRIRKLHNGNSSAPFHARVKDYLHSTFYFFAFKLFPANILLALHYICILKRYKYGSGILEYMKEIPVSFAGRNSPRLLRHNTG